MNRMESRLFRIIFTSYWCMTMNFREASARCEILLRVTLTEDWTNSFRSTDSLRLRLLDIAGTCAAAVHFWSYLIWTETWQWEILSLKMGSKIPYNSTALNRDRNNEFSWRFLNWLLITACRSDCWRWLYKWLRWCCCVWIIRLISWLTWKRWCSVEEKERKIIINVE